jgi:hypothetical protein
MKKIVDREKNKRYYRVLHVPIWLWVFFVLPGNLTYDFYVHGPDKRHAVWLAIVFAVCVWRGLAGRLPGVEPQPYVTHYGADQPNLPYRVVCYTAAWIDLMVPFALNFIGIILAMTTGRWMLADLYRYLYYPLALVIVLLTAFNCTPRARRSTKNEGAEKAWFYVAIWTVVPTQVLAWAAWRLGGKMDLGPLELNSLRFLVFIIAGSILFFMGLKGKLPRSERFYF